MSIAIQDRPLGGLHGIGFPARPELSAETLITLVSLYFVIVCNSTFWHAVAGNGASTGLMASLFVAVFALHAVLFGVFCARAVLKPLLCVLVVATSFATFYMSRYAVLFDVDMIDNILQTDLAESRELLSPGLVWHVCLTGLLPATLLAMTRVKARSLRKGLLVRSAFVIAMLLLAGGAIALSSQGIFAMMRSDHALRYRITPGNYIVSTVRALSRSSEPPPGERLTVAADARVVRAPEQRPRLLVLVVGETLRGDHWGLNGYQRQTTPELASREVINYPDVDACGTSTEVSLPCMFSPYGREHYDRRAILEHESLLDVLARAGVDVHWRDNQSGCKGVCDGTGIEHMSADIAPALCNGERCLDEIMLEGLQAQIDSAPGDLVIVLHQLGNHGPNYFERYPAQFEQFKPTCRTPELSRCSTEEVINAYDNAVLYTDSFLSRALDLVQAQTSHDAAFLYVSDHGESLGEYGLFLHGAPYAIAPRQQLHVPMVAWVSSGLAADSGLDLQCVRAGADAPASHDNLFHSVLGLFDVRTASYRPERDLFAACRRQASAPE